MKRGDIVQAFERNGCIRQHIMPVMGQRHVSNAIVPGQLADSGGDTTKSMTILNGGYDGESIVFEG